LEEEGGVEGGIVEVGEDDGEGVEFADLDVADGGEGVAAEGAGEAVVLDVIGAGGIVVKVLAVGRGVDAGDGNVGQRGGDFGEVEIDGARSVEDEGKGIVVIAGEEVVVFFGGEHVLEGKGRRGGSELEGEGDGVGGGAGKERAAGGVER